MQQSAGALLTGDVIVNGKLRNERKFRTISAYVTQEDLLFAEVNALFRCTHDGSRRESLVQLTVWETLWITCRLRMPTKSIEWVDENIDVSMNSPRRARNWHSMIVSATGPPARID